MLPTNVRSIKDGQDELFSYKATIMHTGRILIVEDSKGETRACRLRLEHEGFNVFSASKLSRAKEILGSHSIDLILLNLQLRNENGADLLKWLQSNTDQTNIPPSIAVTVNEEKQSQLEALTLGAEDVICKPLYFPELIAKINTHLKVNNLRNSLEEKNRSLLATNQRLEQSIFLRRQFLNLITHDLRTPITTIKLATEVLRESLSKSFFSSKEGERFNDLLSVLLRNTIRVEHNFSEIITIGKLDCDDLKLHYSPMDLNTVINDVIESTTMNNLANHQTVHFMPGKIKPLLADVTLIHQLAENLLAITIARTDLTNTVKITTSMSKGMACITVHDDGPHLEENHLAMILKGLNNNMPTPQTRITLYASSRITQAHGGNFTIQSSAVDGTLFIATIPLKPKAE